MRNMLKYLLLAASVAALVSCATVHSPFLSSEEAATKQKLTEELAQYPGLRVTVSGDRVYLEGELQDKAELDHARGVALEAPGVKSVMDDVYLIKVGSMGGDDWP